jgi:hypothetical protein
MAMQVEITIKVDGKTIKTHTTEVSGTLEQMEENLHALGKKVSHDALQGAVDVVVPERPLFRKRAVVGGTRGIKTAR